jgi:hypothetical protein
MGGCWENRSGWGWWEWEGWLQIAVMAGSVSLSHQPTPDGAQFTGTEMVITTQISQTDPLSNLITNSSVFNEFNVSSSPRLSPHKPKSTEAQAHSKSQRPTPLCVPNPNYKVFFFFWGGGWGVVRFQGFELNTSFP